MHDLLAVATARYGKSILQTCSDRTRWKIEHVDQSVSKTERDQGHSC